MSLASPRWPIHISRQVAQHTWEEYHGSLRSLILDFDWTTVLPAKVQITRFHGANDAIGDESYIEELTNSNGVLVDDATHHIALERPDLLINAVRRQH